MILFTACGRLDFYVPVLGCYVTDADLRGPHLDYALPCLPYVATHALPALPRFFTPLTPHVLYHWNSPHHHTTLPHHTAAGPPTLHTFTTTTIYAHTPHLLVLPSVELTCGGLHLRFTTTHYHTLRVTHVSRFHDLRLPLFPPHTPTGDADDSYDPRCYI